jgi:hypothetical protein
MAATPRLTALQLELLECLAMGPESTALLEDMLHDPEASPEAGLGELDRRGIEAALADLTQRGLVETDPTEEAFAELDRQQPDSWDPAARRIYVDSWWRLTSRGWDASGRTPPG